MTDKQKQVIKFSKLVMRDIARVIFLFGLFWASVEGVSYWIRTGRDVAKLVQYVAGTLLIIMTVIIGSAAVYFWIQNRWSQSKKKDVETYEDSR